MLIDETKMIQLEIRCYEILILVGKSNQLRYLFEKIPIFRLTVKIIRNLYRLKLSML